MVHVEVAENGGLFGREQQLIHQRLAVAREILHQAQSVQRVADRAGMQVDPEERSLLVADG